MRWLRRLATGVAALVLAGAAAIGVWALRPASTPAIEGPRAIAALERVRLGHSWGSIVGALAVQLRPDLYHAYVGLGQVVNAERNDVLSYDRVVAEAKRRGDDEALAELATIAPPYANDDELGIARSWFIRYGGSIHAFDRARRVLWSLLFGREYTLATRLAHPACLAKSLDALWRDVGPIDFPTRIPELAVPVVFLAGRHDWNTPYPLVEEWATRLRAPSVEIVCFDDAGHMPPVESPDEFQQALIDHVLPLVHSHPLAARGGPTACDPTPAITRRRRLPPGPAPRAPRPTASGSRVRCA